MFDVGLTEMMVIAVVALVVIGPERLPKVARTAGLILGRLRRYVSDVKADISREIQLEELKNLQKQINEQVMSAEAAVTKEMREVQTSVDSVVKPLASEIAVPPAPTFEAPAAAPPAPLAPGVADASKS
jgi:sec-independent protein translocase protein TatB